MATLAVHSVAARVVELALCGGLLKPSLSASLRLELYGKEFSVFMDEVEKDLKKSGSSKPTLAAVLSTTERPERKEAIVATMAKLCNR